MAMAAPAKAASSAAKATKTVTSKPAARKTTAKSKPPVVSRSTNAVATHAAKTGITTQALAARAQTRVGANKAITKTKTKGFNKQQKARVKTQTQIAQNKAQIRQAELANKVAARNRQQRRSTATDIAVEPFRKHDTVSTPRLTGVNPILLIILTWAGIVILYAMITSPETSVGFFNRSREWVGLLYQTKPIFTTENVSG